MKRLLVVLILFSLTLTADAQLRSSGRRMIGREGLSRVRSVVSSIQYKHSGTTTNLTTIAQVNALTLSAGDSVLFAKGQTYYGQITVGQSGSAGSPIVFGAYGTGAKPVISGGEVLAGWTTTTGGLYVAKASAQVHDIYVDGVRQVYVRNPNGTSLFTVVTTNGTTTVTSASITEATGYWTGATLRYKPYAFVWEAATVSAYDGTTLTMCRAPGYPPVAGWGFYLTGGKKTTALAEMDTTGEWWCDPATDSVYVVSNPSGKVVAGSTVANGFALGGHDYVTIRGLDIQKQYIAAINLEGSADNTQIVGNTISQQAMYAINGVAHPDTVRGCRIDSNIVYDILGKGITIDPAVQDTIVGNTLSSINLTMGYDSTGVSAGAIDVAAGSVAPSMGRDCYIAGNHIDSVGYVGILCGAERSMIELNHINKAMLSFNDGGGIYVHHPLSGSVPWAGVRIRKNLVENTQWNTAGEDIDYPQVDDFYLDGYAWNIRLDSNTSIGASGGGGSSNMFVQYVGFKDTITDNVAYNSTVRGLQVFMDSSYGGSAAVGSHLIKRNIISTDDYGLHTRNYNTQWHSFGTLDSNYFLNNNSVLYMRDSVVTGKKWEYNFWTLAEWVAGSAHDSHSVSITTTEDTIFVNRSDTTQTITLPQNYRSVDNVYHSLGSTITLQPMCSKVLIAITPVAVISGATANGNLETWNSATDAGSWVEDAPGGNAIRDTAASNSGSHALAMYANGGSYCDILQYKTTAGNRYRLTLYAKVNDASGSPSILAWDENAVTYKTITPTTGYVQYSQEFTASSTAFGIITFATGKIFLIDDIVLTKLW